MAVQNHVVELERRHQALEREIHDATSHRSSNDLKMAEMKRKKLHIKDEISKLKSPAAPH